MTTASWAGYAIDEIRDHIHLPDGRYRVAITLADGFRTVVNAASIDIQVVTA